MFSFYSCSENNEVDTASFVLAANDEADAANAANREDDDGDVELHLLG